MTSQSEVVMRRAKEIWIAICSNSTSIKYVDIIATKLSEQEDVVVQLVRTSHDLLKEIDQVYDVDGDIPNIPGTVVVLANKLKTILAKTGVL